MVLKDCQSKLRNVPREDSRSGQDYWQPKSSTGGVQGIQLDIADQWPLYAACAAVWSSAVPPRNDWSVQTLWQKQTLFLADCGDVAAPLRVS